MENKGQQQVLTQVVRLDFEKSFAKSIVQQWKRWNSGSQEGCGAFLWDFQNSARQNCGWIYLVFLAVLLGVRGWSRCLWLDFCVLCWIAKLRKVIYRHLTCRWVFHYIWVVLLSTWIQNCLINKWNLENCFCLIFFFSTWAPVLFKFLSSMLNFL